MQVNAHTMVKNLPPQLRKLLMARELGGNSFRSKTERVAATAAYALSEGTVSPASTCSTCSICWANTVVNGERPECSDSPGIQVSERWVAMSPGITEKKLLILHHRSEKSLATFPCNTYNNVH